MSLAKHGELHFILASTYFSPLAILASVWKKWFPTLQRYNYNSLMRSHTFTALKFEFTDLNKILEFIFILIF